MYELTSYLESIGLSNPFDKVVYCGAVPVATRFVLSKPC